MTRVDRVKQESVTYHVVAIVKIMLKKSIEWFNLGAIALQEWINTLKKAYKANKLKKYQHYIEMSKTDV